MRHFSLHQFNCYIFNILIDFVLFNIENVTGHKKTGSKLNPDDFQIESALAKENMSLLVDCKNALTVTASETSALGCLEPA